MNLLWSPSYPPALSRPDIRKPWGRRLVFKLVAEIRIPGSRMARFHQIARLHIYYQRWFNDSAKGKTRAPPRAWLWACLDGSAGISYSGEHSAWPSNTAHLEKVVELRLFLDLFWPRKEPKQRQFPCKQADCLSWQQWPVFLPENKL